MPRPPPPRGRLDDQRVPDLAREPLRLGQRGYRTWAAGQHRQAGLAHHLPYHGLVADAGHRLHPRTDERDAVLRAHLGEVRVLGQEPVSRMDRVHAVVEGGLDQIGHVQIAQLGRWRSNMDRLVGQSYRWRIRIHCGVDGHRRHAKFLAGANDAQRDLAPIGDEHLAKHGSPFVKPRIRRRSRDRAVPAPAPDQTPPVGRRQPGPPSRSRPPRWISRSSASWPR